MAVPPPSNPTSFKPEFLDQAPFAEILANLDDHLIKRGLTPTVYLAHNRAMGRDEVLKVLGPFEPGHPGTPDRSKDRVLAAARLRHPNIVATYSTTSIGDRLVFAMEYVDGIDLDRLVKVNGPLEVVPACYFAHQAAQGLRYAHEQGIVHGDVTPAHLLIARIEKTRVIKIINCGLAGMTREKDEVEASDIQADLHALGETLHYLLTGNRLFQDPIDRSEVPGELASLVAGLMGRSEGRRFTTSAEVAEALKPFFKKAEERSESEKSTSNRPKPVSDKLTNRRPAWKSPWKIATASVLSLSLLGALPLLIGKARTTGEVEKSSLAKTESGRDRGDRSEPPLAVEGKLPAKVGDESVSSGSISIREKGTSSGVGGPPPTAPAGDAGAPSVEKPGAIPIPVDRAALLLPEPGFEWLKNPGCEEKSTSGIPSWISMSGDWAASPSGTNGIHSHENNAMFLPGSPGPEVDELRQDVDVKEAAEYIDEGKKSFRLVGHVRSQAGPVVGTSQVAIEFLDASKEKVLDRAKTLPIASVDRWEGVELVKDAPRQTRWIRVRLISHAPPGGSHPGLFDGLSLRAREVIPKAEGMVLAIDHPEPSGLPDWPVPGPGDELLQNPDAEVRDKNRVITSWKSMAGDWCAWEKAPLPLTGQAYFCPGGMKVDELQQDVDVSRWENEIDQEKQEFRFVGHVRSRPTTDVGKSQVVIEFLNTAKTKVLGRKASEKFASVGGWIPIVMTSLAPEQTRWIRIRLISRMGSVPSSGGLFDDLSLKAVIPSEEAKNGLPRPNKLEPVGPAAAGDLPYWPVPNPNDSYELLKNRGCEEPAINGVMPNWQWELRTTKGGWLALDGMKKNIRPIEGDAVFQPGLGPQEVLIQPVDVSRFSKEIDKETKKFRFVGRVRSELGRAGPGRTQVVLEFARFRNNKKVSSKYLSSEEFANSDGWEPVELEAFAPKDTRMILVHLIGRRSNANDGLGLFDDLSLRAVNPEPVVIAEADADPARAAPAKGSPEDTLNKLGLTLSGNRFVIAREAEYSLKTKSIRPVIEELGIKFLEVQEVYRMKLFIQGSADMRKMKADFIAARDAEFGAMRFGNNSYDKALSQNIKAEIDGLRQELKEFDADISAFTRLLENVAFLRDREQALFAKKEEFLRLNEELKPLAEKMQDEYRRKKDDPAIKNAISEFNKSSKIKATLGPSNNVKNTFNAIRNAELASSPEAAQEAAKAAAAARNKRSPARH